MFGGLSTLWIGCAYTPAFRRVWLYIPLVSFHDLIRVGANEGYIVVNRPLYFQLDFIRRGVLIISIPMPPTLLKAVSNLPEDFPLSCKRDSCGDNPSDGLQEDVNDKIGFHAAYYGVRQCCGQVIQRIRVSCRRLAGKFNEVRHSSRSQFSHNDDLHPVIFERTLASKIAHGPMIGRDFMGHLYL